MRKRLLLLLSMAIGLGSATMQAAVPDYNAAQALASARADIQNWMKYLPDDMYVAHVSIPGTHDTATAEGWSSSTGPTYSTTQAVTIDEQLEKGIRAFDFRPGLVDGYLNCNHGTDKTKLKLEDAMTKLTNYLDAHPSEFFVIHFFRGNVYNNTGDASTGVKLLGGKDDDASRATYNSLMDALYNQKLANYIIDYSPYLTVKEMRGKIVLFRRDRIQFVDLKRAGNLTNWPGDAENWTETNYVTATNASNPALKGRIFVTDVSSPDNADEQQVEINSITNLFARNCGQTRPNAAKVQGSYKPDWSFIFTSGAYGGENTKGYLSNATTTNPLLTNLINTATQHGPTGVVFSDWVLTDSHTYSGTTYATMGIPLVTSIIENNFSYAEEFLLDDELFADDPTSNIDIFEGKTFFMRNVGTGLFLTAGANWGTHAALGEVGIRITPTYDSANKTYTLATSLGGGNIGWDGGGWYVDWAGSGMEFKPVYSGQGTAYAMLATIDGAEKAMTPVAVDGFLNTKYSVDPADYVEGDPMQMWEMISEGDLITELAGKAKEDNPVDLTFVIRGNSFLPNDADNTSGWNWVTNSGTYLFKTYKSVIDVPVGVDNWNDKDLVLRGYNEKASGASKYTNWGISQEITGLPNGIYTLSVQAINYAGTNLSFTVNGTELRDKISDTASSGSIEASDAITKFRSDPAKYTVSLEKFVVTDGKISIAATKSGTSSATAVVFDNFRLTYYGLTEEQANEAYERVEEFAEYARMQATGLGLEEVYDNSEVERRLAENAIANDGYEEIQMTMEALRNAVLTQDNEGADLTLAIYNPSFEFAPDYSRTDYNIGGSYPLGWDYPANYVSDSGVWPATDINKATSNPDGSYIFNTWDWGSAFEGGGRKISQKINLTPGLYQLKALVSSHQNNTVYIYAGNEQAGHTMSGDKSAFEEVTLEFFVSAEGPVEIGALGGNTDGSFNADGTGVFYKVDNFRLTRLRNAEVIEYTPMGKYDTLILPFDVDMSDERYTDLAICEIKTSTEHEHYVQLELGWPDSNELKANVPYIVEYLAYVEPEESEQPAQAPAMRAAAESGTFTFAGVPTHTATTYTDASGLLIGSHSEQTPATGEFVMNHNANVGSAFTRVEEEDSPVVASHRAYISLPSASEKVTHVLLDEAQENTFITTGISAIEISADTEVDVYSVSGILLRRNVRASEALDGLAAGLYILRSETSTAKAVCR